MHFCTAGPMGFGLLGGSQRFADIHAAGSLCHSCALWPATVPLRPEPLPGGRGAAIAAQGCCHYYSLPLWLRSQLQTVGALLQSCMQIRQGMLLKLN